MKIVYCLQGLKCTGGIERVTTSKANYWAERGHEVHIVTTDQMSCDIAFELDPRVKHHDLAINYEEDNKLGRFKRYLALPKRKRLHKERLTALLMELKADIVVSTFFQDASFLPDIKDGSKKVLESHTARRTKILQYPKERQCLRWFGELMVNLNERIARRFDRFIILTEEERYKYKGFSNLEVIPNPRPFVSEEGGFLRTKQVLAVGRFEYQKNFSELIDIWSTIASRHPDWRLVIVGSGHLRGSLEQQIKDLKLSSCVSLLHSTSQIRAIYAESAIYALVSHYEGLPMVLLEAQAMGLPIVSYTCQSGPRDIVNDGIDGFLVEEGDRLTFVQRLEQLMQSEQLRQEMGVNAQANSERFALDVVMKRWEDTFYALK